MEFVLPIMGEPYTESTIPAAGNATVSMRRAPVPCTLWLDSTNGSRSIQISVDEGVNFFTPTYDTNTTAQLVVAITAPISHVKFTGTTGEAYGIR